MRDYLNYLEEVREYGGNPVTEEEFNNQMQEEREIK